MPPSTPWTAIAAIAALALSFPAAPAAAQEAAKPLPRVESVRACPYTLAHSDPSEISGLLLALFDGQEPAVKITGDRRTNTMVVFATESVHRHIQELLGTLDREVGGEQGSEETRIIRVQHQSIESLAPVAELHRIQYALARATNSFIARGRSTDLDRFAATIAELDVDTPAIELEGWILEAGRGEPVEKHAELAPLAAELARSGLGGYGASSRWSIRSLAGEEFRTSQEFQGRRLDRLVVEGRVRLVDEGRNAQVSLEIEVRTTLEDPSDLATEEESAPPRGVFEVETTLETQPGKLVVIGLAPTGDEKSKPLVLVVRVKP
jgi:hypothetical protein